MGVLLPIIMALGIFASMLGLYNSELGSSNIKQVLADKYLAWSYQAAMTGIREAVVSPAATNRLNFINGAMTPYNPDSGLLKNSSGSTIAMYRYMAFGGDPHRNASGAYDSTRLNALSSIHPRYVVAVGTTCMSQTNHAPIASALAINTTNGTLSCSSGTKTEITVFGKVSMGTLVSAVAGNNPLLWTRVWNGSNASISTEGPQIFVPGYGLTRTFGFETAWQGGSTASTQAAGLYRVAVKEGATWNAYDATGASPIYLPDAGYTTRYTTPTFKVLFNGPIDFRTLYPSTQTTVSSNKVNYSACYADALPATRCNLYAQKQNDPSPNLELRVLPVLPAGSQVMMTGTFPSYSNTSGAASNSLYSLNFSTSSAAVTVYDWWGKSVSTAAAYFKVADPVVNCSVPTTITPAASTTQTLNDPTRIYTVNVTAGRDNIIINITNACTNTVSVATNGSDEITITQAGGGSVNLSLPVELASYSITGTTPKRYDLACGNHDVRITGTHTPTYGAYSCASTCASGETWDGSACVSVCPSGEYWDGYTCQSLCASDETWDGSSCVPDGGGGGGGGRCAYTTAAQTSLSYGGLGASASYLPTGDGYSCSQSWDISGATNGPTYPYRGSICWDDGCHGYTINAWRSVTWD